MYSSSSTSLSIDKPASCLKALGGDASRHRFAVGTCAARDANEVRILDYDEERNVLKCCGAFRHAAPVTALAPSPSDASLFLVCGQTSPTGAGAFEASLVACDAGSWEAALAEGDDDDAAGVLRKDGWAASARVEASEASVRATLGGFAGPCAGLAWAADGRVAACSTNALALY
eukprot:CAMPEP_0119276104 /NCGR_PEP_ID=MMETSP1329-20130426/14887_1 /TAXON_ID=114041 /ORGANISM="Genus nov. species nov., Strain RCC1024" /LENGTH=173 /DNA_ID=CAMNT_0007276527 /DNA_START=147 /DNA_END=665 /DNA_ORIENTATION=-